MCMDEVAEGQCKNGKDISPKGWCLINRLYASDTFHHAHVDSSPSNTSILLNAIIHVILLTTVTIIFFNENVGVADEG